LETRDREFPNPTRRFRVLRRRAEDSQICDLRKAKGARSRIKIQYIEFLCDMRRRARKSPIARQLNLRFNCLATGSGLANLRLSRSEGGSDFREAKVEATFAKRRWKRLSRSEGGCDFREAKVDATLCERWMRLFMRLVKSELFYCLLQISLCHLKSK
jgi:hypothetical protein